jgi:hypothetical protein
VTTLNVNTIEPAGNTLTIGASGDTVVLADDVKSNTYKDAGGNTLFVSDGSGNLSSVNSGFGDALKLLSTQTASTSASISFTSGIDSTYKEYIFKFYNIHPSADGEHFTWQANASGESGYNETITSSAFHASHTEANNIAAIGYDTASDLAEGTGYQPLMPYTGNDADMSFAGELHIFNPSSTTYITHFISRATGASQGPYHREFYIAGYINTTAAITGINFKYGSGNIDAGKIKMYGVA